MKKLSIFCLLVFAVILSFGQNDNINWGRIQNIEYPMTVTTKSEINGFTYIDTNYIFGPNDLSIYCLNQSEKYITKAKSSLISAATFSIIGGIFLGIGAALPDNKGVALTSIGAGVEIIGVILDLVFINDLLQFAKWNHREKAVQFTVKPTGVALSF